MPERTPIRAALPSALLFCGACATDRASGNELAELRAEVRALRAENDRLEKRLERLELRDAVRRGFSSADEKPDALPPLTVVKLKPKPEAAPKIDTATPVVEPDPSVVAELSPPPRRSEPAEVSEVVDEVDAHEGERIFESGVEALKTGNVAGGVQKLLAFAEKNGRHPKADNALYFASVGLMGLDAHEDAARQFERLLAKYPASDAAVDAMLKLAECRVRLGRTIQAKVTYEKIIQTYPGTPAAAQAQEKLASLDGRAESP